MMQWIEGSYNFHNIILVGGGAFLFKKAVKAAFPKHTIHEVKDPMYANRLSDRRRQLCSARSGEGEARCGCARHCGDAGMNDGNPIPMEPSQSVRDIYRKLASVLHPDRETDPTERERKTALIQRANQAYGRNDLLELLTLQIETEQIDAGALADIPEARLRHYNDVLQPHRGHVGDNAAGADGTSRASARVLLETEVIRRRGRSR
jgi:hypothetical protein